MQILNSTLRKDSVNSNPHKYEFTYIYYEFIALGVRSFDQKSDQILKHEIAR